MTTPEPPASPNNKNDLGKKKQKNKFSLRPDQNRGPAQKADRSHPVQGARRINRTQGR